MNQSPTLSFRLFKHLHDRSLLASAIATPERQLGNGWVYSLLPITDHLYGKRPEQQQSITVDQLGFMGGNPDLLPLATGAMARAIHDTANETESTHSLLGFHEWLSTSLQLLGWKLFRDGWRPLLLLVGFAIGWYAYSSSNSTRALAVLLFLLLFNIPLWIFRSWSVRYGWKHGIGLINKLSEWRIDRYARYMRWTGAALTGAVFVIAAREWGQLVFTLAAQAAEGLAWISIATGFLTGYLLQRRTHQYYIVLVVSLAVIAAAKIF